MLLSTLAGEAGTGIDLTTVRIGNLQLHLNRRLSSKISLGDSSAEVGPEDEDGVPTLVFPRRRLISHINDNYCVVPTVQLDSECQSKTMAKTLDSLGVQTIINSVVSKTLNSQDVCCRVVSHVRTVHSHGLPQRKGVSPGHCLSKIKHVKGVFCVNPCLSVPPVPNVPNAVAGQIVGGRLQQFWHIWQEMGANPRVVSVLKDGYSLAFSQRPLLTRVLVAERIEAPQRVSTRAVYKSKWTIFVKWCESHEMDFRSPSVNQIADFLLHLFKERNLQPSTIEGYRTAIADMVGNSELNISKDENLVFWTVSIEINLREDGVYLRGTYLWFFTS